MRIASISVAGLFGMFNHSIQLNLSDRITLIHGPNGIGKTVTLGMLESLMNGSYGALRRSNFARFEVRFDNGGFLLVERTPGLARVRDGVTLGTVRPATLLVTASIDGLATVTYDPDAAGAEEDEASNIVWALEQVPQLRREGANWHDAAQGDVIQTYQAYTRYRHSVRTIRGRSKEPPELTTLRASVPVRQIHTQRLRSPSHSPSATKKASPDDREDRATVEAYAEELLNLMREARGRYADASQNLDRDFPNRLVYQSDDTILEVNVLRERLDRLEEARARLGRLGLIDPEEGLKAIPPELLAKRRDVLSIYVADVEKKLADFDDVAGRLQLFVDTLNRRFQHKSVSISRTHGLSITSTSGSALRPRDLSSGEQHELVLVFELVFKVRPNTIVLIDEPEISLHVAWQERFLSDLGAMATVAEFDAIVATHSPEIIGRRWDLTVLLSGPDEAA